MRKEALIGFSVLLVAVSGSATVLDSFGVISGEADVEPAVELVEVKSDTSVSNNDGEYLLFENNFGSLEADDWIVEQNDSSSEQEFSEVDDSEIMADKFALADEDAEFSNYGDIQIYELSSVLGGIPANDDEVLFLKHKDPKSVIQEVDYKSCSSDGEAYDVVNDECADSNIEVNDQ